MTMTNPSQVLTNALDALLALDPDTAKRLKKLEGRVVQIELTPLPIRFQCHFVDSHLTIVTNTSATADTIIRGTPLQLLSVSLTKTNRQRFFADDVVMEGDATLGQAVIDLFDSLTIDWEDLLANSIGDTPSYHLSRFAKRIKTIARHTARSLKDNVTEYIHEEAEWLPTQEHMQDFFTDIDIIRNAVDRAEARINRLLTLSP